MKKFILISISFLVLCISTTAQNNSRETGYDSFQAGKYDDAVKHLLDAVQANRTDRNSWMYLGASYLKLKNRKEARNSFKAGMKIDVKPGENNVFSTEPFKITHKPQARVTDEVRQYYESARAKLIVELKMDGTIGFAYIVTNTALQWETELLNAVRGIKFEPAMRNGVPVTSLPIIEYSYTKF